MNTVALPSVSESVTVQKGRKWCHEMWTNEFHWMFNDALEQQVLQAGTTVKQTGLIHYKNKNLEFISTSFY